MAILLGPAEAEFLDSGILPKTRELGGKQPMWLLVKGRSKNMSYSQSYCLRSLLSKVICALGLSQLFWGQFI